jgi:hypothetical protein
MVRTCTTHNVKLAYMLAGSLPKPVCQPRAPARKSRLVQLRRAKGWRMPANTVKVDRSTLFGNPFSVKEYGHDHAVALHSAWLFARSIVTGAPARRRLLD